jgi:hypothetical protein
LQETAKWTKFLAILGMIVLVLVLLVTLLGVTIFTSSLGMRFGVNSDTQEQVTNSLRVGLVMGTIIMIAIAFFPLFYLLQFANRMKKALAANQQNDLNDAFLNLKKYFRYLGIIAIIVLVLYAFVFVMAIIGGTLYR